MIEAQTIAARDDAPAEIAGRYRVLSTIGRGGMGAVFCCEHLVTGRKCAVKRLHAEYAREGEVVARFLREAKIAGALNHPGIVEVLDAGVDADGAFLVMELLEGSSLEDAIERRDRSDGELCGYVCEALRALSVAHRAGIVHRDLKPANIFVARREGRTTVKLLDFGISKIERHQEGDFKLTRTGTILGTPYFMPPEQARGLVSVSGASDLYSMGVVLFQCLSGQLPFDGPNYNALLAAILTAETPSLADRRGDLPPDLVALVRKAMDRDPTKRFASAAAMADALEPFCALNTFGDRGLALGATLPHSAIRQTRGSPDTLASSAKGATPAALSGELPALDGSPVASSSEQRSPIARLRVTRAIGGVVIAVLLGASVTYTVARRRGELRSVAVPLPSSDDRANANANANANAVAVQPRVVSAVDASLTTITADAGNGAPVSASTSAIAANHARIAARAATNSIDLRAIRVDSRSAGAASTRSAATRAPLVRGDRPSTPTIHAPGNAGLGRGGQTIDHDPFNP